MTRKILILTALSIGLTGCANLQDRSIFSFLQTNPSINPVAPIVPIVPQAEMDRLMQHRLLEAAASIDTTLKLIERIERGPVQSASNPNSNVNPNLPKTGSQNSEIPSDPLNVRLKIVWKNGTPEELLAKLSSQIGFVYKETGRKTNITPINIDVNGETARSIFESVGRQINQKADIVLHKTSNPMVLELHYK